jgi:hypothetical protein
MYKKNKTRFFKELRFCWNFLTVKVLGPRTCRAFSASFSADKVDNIRKGHMALSQKKTVKDDSKQKSGEKKNAERKNVGHL